MEPHVGGSRTVVYYSIVSESAREPDRNNIICSPTHGLPTELAAYSSVSAISNRSVETVRISVRNTNQDGHCCAKRMLRYATGSTAVFTSKGNARKFYYQIYWRGVKA